MNTTHISPAKSIYNKFEMTRKLFLLLTLITLGASNVWAQTDYSGTYYIRSTGRYASNADVYYLCPTENWYFYKATNGYAETDNGYPFLTTYKIKAHADYDISKAVWGIEKHPSETDCYYIKQLKTGRYMVSNGQISGSTNANRVRVHLETVADAAALAALGDMALFEITEHDDHLDIVPHAAGGRNGDNKYLVVNNGNYDQLDAQNSKTDFVNGKYTRATGGIISLFTHEDNAQFKLEKTVMPPTITYDEETGNATITSVPGTTIRYALDSGTPTASGTSYTSPTDPIAVSGHTAIKAIAVDAEDNISAVVTMSLRDYTYHILNKAGTVAIQKTVTQPVGMALSGYTNIPADIRSRYIDGETIKFYSNSNHADENEIHATPSATSDIYVTYTTDLLKDKYLHLRGARPLNVTVNGEYIYDSGSAGSGVLDHTASDDDIATNPYLWFFEGLDPYAVQIRNGATDNILDYATPSTLSLASSPTNGKFIIMGSCYESDDSQQMELMAATGGSTYYRVELSGGNLQLSTTAAGAASVQVTVKTNSAPVTYHLIDQAGRDLLQISSTSESVTLPSEWQSPLVSAYHYWKIGAFDIYGDVYKLKANPESYVIEDLLDVEGGDIYVTYDVDDDVNFDLTNGAAVGGSTYMLKFYGGETFNQEDGKDGVGAAEKAVYPYCNGDAMLYVYGEQHRTNQFNSGASTRPRWLWYVVSPEAPMVNTGAGTEPVTPGYKGDPYHVKIMSHSTFSTGGYRNFFRTFAVEYGGETHVVTSATTNHSDLDGLTDLQPTEYMVLNAPNGRSKLVTVNKINGDHQTVTSFEQYWKNNPTVQNELGGAKVVSTESFSDNITLTPTQVSQLSNDWHTYQIYAYAAPWVGWKTDTSGTGKQYKNKNHWFQTIDMGSTGEFTFEPTLLEPQVILLDQHGWEVMRAPLSDVATLRKYDSPMVTEYHWYPSAEKAAGYHKYTVDNQAIPVYYSAVNPDNGRTVWLESGDYYTHNSTSLADDPYSHFTENSWEEQPASVKTDFYVTYTVAVGYALTYPGAATSVTPASSFLLKQGNDYAKIVGTNLETVTSVSTNPEDITDDLAWYLRPNFNIDAEMGYRYRGEEGAEDDALSKDETETAYYEAGKNGFDPYNVQVQSKYNTFYYFTTNTTGSHLVNGIWVGEGTGLSLQNMSAGVQPGVEGNDQTTLVVTNATFMVVNDGNGHMRLMPRFDNSKVIDSFTSPHLKTLAAASTYLTLEPMATVIHSLDEIAFLNGNYILANDIDDASSYASMGSAEAPFTGILNGAGHTISGLTAPLFAYTRDAVIKNIILDEVSISTDDNAGAIAAVATGDTRIYNCGILSGSVGGTGKVGGLVGLLDGYARVIHCYSYATIAGGADVGGIVGYNNYASKASDIRTMVMNCIFYGDITGGTNVSPVYGGLNINNLNSGGLNTFNYYAYDELKTSSITAGKYNCALAIEEKNLKRFEFYRLLLNSNRRLAAYYASSPLYGDVYEENMMKFVLETADRSIAEPKPYPVLKAQDKYPSIINYDAENAPIITLVDGKPSEEDRNKGGQLGKTLRVHLSGTGITTTELTLQCTDKDFDRYNYNYDKVQLPYFNEVGEGNYTNNQVVTGWEITGMTGGTAGTFREADDFGGYNFADRNCTQKDIYSVSHRVFSQGAYFDVPYGVTDIYIQPHWATAAYVADEYLDVVNTTSYGAQSVTQLGEQFPTGKITINGSEQTVYNSFSSALAGKSSSSVYDLAIVLVGNLHQSNVPSGGDVPFTVMSADLNHDNEPDYSMIYHHTNRTAISPIRFDFLNIPGTAQAQKPNGASNIRNFTIFKTKGWFETTNTVLVYSNQVEYENLDGVTKAANSPLILQGGDFEQFVSTQSKAVTGMTNYIHVGGNVHILSFGLGTHSDGSQSTPHVPVSVTGGEYDGFYLTGTYNANAQVRTDNAECYISGGYFKEAAGASLEQINGNVHWQIYNADIDAFFGGGINEAKPITGDVATDIYNSYVTLFCGGPKFGNMQTNKTVTTTAEGCVFGKFFGAGYGGTSIARKKYYDKDGNQDWTTLQGYYTGDRGKYFDGSTTGSSQLGGKDYGKKGLGVATDFDYEFFVWSTGTTGARFFVNFASFSLAQCNDVNSNLTNCTINQDFYGGGSLGKVIGKATSILDGCTVHGSVFGGGYSATLPTIQVRDAGFTNKPNFNSNTGMFEPGEFSGTTEFTWKNAAEAGVTLTNGQSGSDLTTNHYIYTNADLTALGQVKETDLTVRNNCKIEGSVYGGGDMSSVYENTLVKIENVKTSGDTQYSIPNVYGGGNTADVDGDTEVILANGTVAHDIFGGGRGETTTVAGNATVNIGEKTGTAPSFTYTGTGLVEGDVYGGSALGAVNATKGAGGVLSATADKVTTVNVFAGTVDGSVYGGGLGEAPTVEPVSVGIAAQNWGNTFVNIENNDNSKALVTKAIYGGANVYGVMKADVEVTLLGGTVGAAPEPATAIVDRVFGGGRGVPTLVNGNVTVNVGTMTPATPPATPTYAGAAVIYGNVYGGSALGNTAADKIGSAPMTFDATKTTNVNLFGGTIHGNVFGGGLGQKAAAEVEPVESFVGGDVNVLLDGAKLTQSFTGEGENRMPLTGQIFGANNYNGTPKGHVLVHVKRTVDSAPSDATAFEDRTTYDVYAVYGGGNQADYIPADTNPETTEIDTEDFAQVIIEGCDLTRIEYVYGGGNAAAVPATDVTVKGTYIIDYLFGGGNGKSTATFTNPGADIGRYKVNDVPTYQTYGSGVAKTTLYAGKIRTVFGGSNTKGNVLGGTSMTMPPLPPTPPSPEYCSKLEIKNIYGAGNEAEQDGDVNLILGCVDGMENVYGGAKNAHIAGGVNLTITSGHFTNVFGGNDQSGTIQGGIKLNIEETGCDPVTIDNLYLGGNLAPYSVYGYKDDGEGNLVARNSMTDGTAVNPPASPYSESQLYRDPEMNVISCTHIKNVYGGGYGSTANLYGSPTVNVNMVKGNQAGLTASIPETYADIPNITGSGDAVAGMISRTINDDIGTVGNVFGGGEEANVYGNATVNIGTATTVTMTSVADDPATDGVNEHEPTVLGAHVTGSVYGGGKDAVIDGNTKVFVSAQETGVDTYATVTPGASGVTIAKDVFGAGLGQSTAVNYTTVVMGGGEVGQSVYGGGEMGHVEIDTKIYVLGGAIGDPDRERGGEVYGNVYGGGKGELDTDHLDKGLIKGNTNINITGGTIYHNIYGGGAFGSVGTYTYNPSTHENTRVGETGTANITITGGTIGINGRENGMVFGSSRGGVAKPSYGEEPNKIDPNNLLAWVYDANVTIGTENDETPGPWIKGSVYGSGENGHTYNNTLVTVNSGTIGINSADVVEYATGETYSGPAYNYPYRGNVYGGGCGTDKYDSDDNGEVDAYNPESGIVRGTSTVIVKGGTIVRNVYGAGAMGSVIGLSTVDIRGGNVGAPGSVGGYVYAAARGDESLDDLHQAYVGASALTVSGGTVNGDAFGGGQAGIVKGAVTVNLTGGTLKQDVYGGGALAKVNTEYHADDHPTYVTTVTMSGETGATVVGNVYGGGLGRLEDVGESITAVAADVDGPVKVVVIKGSAANVFGCNNINGAPQHTVEVEIGTKTGASAPYTYGGTAVIGNVYGGGNQAAYSGTPTVKLYGGTVNTNVYGGGLGATAITGGTSVTMEGGTVNNDVFGGGSQADVTGSVAVTVAGGTVVNDVYGGGALANTNTANWDGDNLSRTYEKITGTLTVGSTVVTGLYKKVDEDYILVTAPDAKAEIGVEYYRLFETAWAEGKTSASNTTTVKLTGGTIGNVYGGGLGNDLTPVYVYGDVVVNVNNPSDISTYGGTGAAFTRELELNVTVDGKNYPSIPVTGSIFGANNFNGSPKGDVTVEIWATKRVDGKAHVIGDYEVQAVYGGGNLANYLPAIGKQTSVIIHGCNDTSIEKVYGGGNSATVPTSNVTILGAFDIGYAFGGGNGSRPVRNSAGVWMANAGATVTGDAHIYAKGGRIGQVFGGSDAKGDILGDPTIDTTSGGGECSLSLTRIFGAGNEADVSGDVTMILSGCSTSDAVQFVHGGSYNAHISGNINLTITSGIYTNVFGGNDARGSIGGHIIVNIEETDDCKPIIIHNLMGGGNEAPYPGTKKDGSEYDDSDDRYIEVNVKSATRIDNIFGGGLKADVRGNTTVNINMLKGSQAGAAFSIPASYTGDPIPNIAEGVIKDEIGTIGNVYGGGNEGNVTGSSTVNIGTASEVDILKRAGDVFGGEFLDESDRPVYDGEGKIIKDDDVPRTVAYVQKNVLGAHITGDVFGGGNAAYVTGDATVNVCTADYSALLSSFEGVSIGQSVYGGGKAGDVLGNTFVTMSGGNRTEVDGAYVFDGVYGGGLRGSVGTAADGEGSVEYHTGAEAHTGCIGKIVNYKSGTGKCTVVVSGGQIGPKEVAMTTGGMKNTGNLLGLDGPVDVGFVFGAGRGEVEDPAVDKDADFRTFVKETDVTIDGTALIMASVYGGGENGRVSNDTHVKIKGGQIGCSELTAGVPKVYNTTEWADENTADFKECQSWDYGKVYPGDTEKKYLPYDPYASDTNPEARTEGSDGHTYYGNVFGGGSGYYPYEKADGTHDWLRSAGQVYGNTRIDITGGHILTSVYGGNEVTDVGTYTREDGQIVVSSGGKCTINMVGGTLGVPRTDLVAQGHPVTCYLFGAGKGDQRTHFNTWTNVQETEVNVSGTARIFGSVFGGGEDGHILGNAAVNIGGEVKIDLNGDGDTDDSGETFTAGSSLKIGTTGTSYVDGNVFGGGRGFSGVALTAGSTGGNVTMNISNGTMLGSVYGGGRLASVGIGFTSPEDIYYGQLVDDVDENGNGEMESAELKHGHITINISGGTIGNGTTETGTGHPVTGNVYGGCMGRITYLNGERNPLWPKQAVAKESTIDISGGTIYNSVYGGGEIGIVRNRATVNVSGGTIYGNVFGGGYGSDEQDKTTISAGGYDDIPTVHYTFSPMIWTGCVSGDTFVNVSGGHVKKNVYGGGNFASVGLMNYNSDETGTVYNFITKHNITDGFGLSWPYEFQYIQHAPTDDAPGGKKIGGKTTVNITGGRIGTTPGSGSGNVFGGSKGQVSFTKEDNTTPITDVNEQRYAEAFCANVRETEVNINYGSTPTSDDGSETACIVGAVYGGGQDGHVYENAEVNITGGLIGLSVYGGGEGESTFDGYLRNGDTPDENDWKATTEPIHSITAGKVYGNTSVTMDGGLVVGHIYGGGNLASVGKGNYAGGLDDYYPAGYGETLAGNLWDNVSDNSKAFLNSGHVTVTITGGEVGTPGGTVGTVYGSTEATPTGMVFGGSRGRVAEDVALAPRHEYAPDFYLGYVNNTEVTIGNAGGGPEIYSQVFGGGRDGHVRDSTHVIVNNGTIGQPYSDFGDTAADDYQRYHRGNVYGSGSGLGQWATGKHGMSSGSVTNKTRVDINGGTIYNNVYGGGALSSVGPPRLDMEKDYAPASLSKCVVNINGGTIGQTASYESSQYGGCVYGASRGNDFEAGESPNNFATVLWTQVNINGGSIAGKVYGGAKGGIVWKDTEVNLKGGRIYHDAYGGGQGTNTIAADVGGNTRVELNNNNGGAEADGSKKGCIVDKVFGCNDMNGTPKGHVYVHVYGTQNRDTENMQTKVGPGKRTTLDQGDSEGYIVYMERLVDLATDLGVSPSASVMTAAQATITGKVEVSLTDGEKTAISTAATNVIKELQNHHDYDVTAVYGGGDLAPYVPALEEDRTEVIIEGCDVTSIKQVYGGGNAAYVPASDVLVKSAYVIDELFGGGNGADNYVKDGEWYENPGANVGYKQLAYYDTTSGTHGTGADEANKYTAITYTDPDATTKEGRRANYSIGTGIASTMVNGGYIHSLYGGSNMKGNIRAEALLQVQQAGACELIVDQTTAGSKSADIDAQTNTTLECVREGGVFYAGSTNADILNDVHVRITNGHYTKVFGGNKTAGTITGSITIDIEEQGCTPIEIDSLFVGGYLAPYSVYGYSTTTRDVTDEYGNTVWIDPNDHSEGIMQQRIPYKKGDAGALATPSRDPQINIISATRIGKIFGGCYMAELVGSPHINVNMTKGVIIEKYASEYPNATYPYITAEDAAGNKIIPVGTIGTIYGGGYQGDVYGDTYVDIGTGEWLNINGQRETADGEGKIYTYNTTTEKWDWTKKVGDTTESGTVDDKPLPARNAAYIIGDVVAGKSIGGQVYGGGDHGYVHGNTNINMVNGYVYDRIYGGGNEGTVGTVATRDATGHASHSGCIGGKPTSFAANTGRTAITMSGGYLGPFSYVRSASTGVATIVPMHMPDDFGYVFGAGRGMTGDPTKAGNEDIEFMTYVDSTVVVISDSALVAGGVYGGAERGRVLHNTWVYIKGGQIGLGKDMTTAFTEDQWTQAVTAIKAGDAAAINTLATGTFKECASWEYTSPWLAYDENAGNGKYKTATYGAASTTGTDGHTFYGNVFGGGSGYFAYEKADEAGVYDWLMSSGLVEGNTNLVISGGHILTNAYGGNEMTNVTGSANVTMTGGTLGVPRTQEQIAAHPVTCYLFGGGKGDTRVHFSKSTNVGHANVRITDNAFIFGSVFGGGEDGHVMGNVDMTISDVTDISVPENPVTSSPWIGTWGSSYVDGNVFGGGRGFSAEAYTAGNVAGSVNLTITGGTMLGSIYGGGRLASVGYGLYMANETYAATGHQMYGEMQDDNYDDWVNPGTGYDHPARSNFSRGHITLSISGDKTVIGNKYEFIYPDATNIAAYNSAQDPDLDADFKNWTSANWTAWKDYYNVPLTTFDTSNGRVTHTKGGNVYAGGMGRRVQLDGVTEITAVDWRKLGNVKRTNLTISGAPWIMGNVYGGCEMGTVRDSETKLDGDGSTIVTITGGTIGTEVTGGIPTKDTVALPATYPETGNSNVLYTYGSVYGGGMGAEEQGLIDDHGGNVENNTTVTMSGADTKVRGSIYGACELATIGGDTHVTINGGEVGRNEVQALDGSDPGYVMFGGATMGNVYGGGKGELDHVLTGRVIGNTNVTITGGNIYHNVYGGGALGSVGKFELSTGTVPANMPPGVPYWPIGPGWVDDNAGIATVTITGGTIGISGRDNGLVFGSSRGDLKKPEDIDPDPIEEYIGDPYDKVAWVKGTVVTIGTAEGSRTSPLIRGSVYGGGENGHNYQNATVNVLSGTIGIPNKNPATGEDEPWWDFGNETLNTEYRAYRGNVYGAGSGSDTYPGDDGMEHYNPRAGMVGGSSVVNIRGGHIGRSVYGAGAMASLGNITNGTDTISGQPDKHEDGFALSWPYRYVFAPMTGKATVNVTGGHIGTLDVDGGDVYGGARGAADDRYYAAHLAYANETEVNINYPSTYEAPEGEDLISTIDSDFSIPCITGSVHGSGEDGFVYGDATVTLTNGLIGHSLYGAGKGTGTYTRTLSKIGGGGSYSAKIYSLIAGRVMGNTYVTMLGGHVGRNVYGGGNMGSVGKGNYASGEDDYAYDCDDGKAYGYGEKIAGNLWEHSEGFNPNAPITTPPAPGAPGSYNQPITMADYFLSSGKATVKVFGGTVGYINATDPTLSIKNNLPYGNVFGGSAGEAAPNIFEIPRYEYSPAFFSGYVNETDVTIGKSRSDFATDEEYATYLASGAPKILASVFGGGQDGHVRRDTRVTVNSGEIGLPYTNANQTLLQTSDVNDPMWLFRGNVYGAGSGVSHYRYDFNYDGDFADTVDYGPSGFEAPTKEEDYSNSAGSVTRFTQVDIKGGTIHQNVYGGGSMASVGPPNMGQTYLPYKKGDTADGHGVGRQSYCQVNIWGTVGTPTDFNPAYGGNVYGASRGVAGLDTSLFGYTIWTQVNLFNGANVMNNVFGGGDNGMVKRDAEVNVGE